MNKVFINNSGAIEIIDPLEVVFIKIEKGKSIINFVNGKFLTISKSLVNIHDYFKEDFIRVHNSYIVNLHHIISFKSKYLTLSTKDTIPLSRGKKKELESMFL
jgi:DNA-binding LytR/AlgR family response regulator